VGTQIDGRTLRYQHRRGELLEAVGEYVLDNGVASLSLRRVADAVGVSHVTLQHHFGSKDQLVNEIVEHLLERTLVPQGVYPGGAPDPARDLPTRWRALWAHLTSAPGQRDIRLFTEVLGQSLFGQAGYTEGLERSMRRRLDLVTTNVIALGCPEEEAGAFATVMLATFRGLVMDLLVTGERERLDKAFERALATAELRAAEWSTDIGRASLPSRSATGHPAVAG
jgi:AcrR family transcriptional regulator